LDRCLAPAEAARPAPPRLPPLRVNQIITIFEGRLVLSVLDIDSEARRVRVRLNFVREDRQVDEDLAVGDSYGFRLGGRDWSLVAAGLTLTTANLNLMEIKSDP
jgi:hypothetical protein